MVEFKAKFNWKVLIIALVVMIPLIFFLNPEFIGILFGILVVKLVRQYLQEKKQGKKLPFFSW